MDVLPGPMIGLTNVDPPEADGLAVVDQRRRLRVQIRGRARLDAGYLWQSEEIHG